MADKRLQDLSLAGTLSDTDQVYIEQGNVAFRVTLASLKAYLGGTGGTGGTGGGTTMIYYVDPAGSDSNDGLSQGTAWQTIAKVNAFTFLAPTSTTIKFKGGSSFSGNLAAVYSGLTFDSYGTGRATINAGSGTGFYALNKSGVTVQNINFVGNGITTNAGNGIVFENSQAGDTKLAGATVINCDVTAFGKNGIIIVGSAGSSGFNNVLISGCNAYGNCGNYVGHGSAGIMVYSDTAYGSLTKAYAHTNVHITNCKTYNNTGTAGNSNWTGSGLVVLSTDGGLVEFCESYSNGANNVTAPNGPVGIWACEANAIVIQYCESYNNTTGTTDGGGFDLDGGCTNCTIQYCYSHGNAGHGFMSYMYSDATIKINANITICFNISQNDGKGGIGVFNGDSRTITGLAIYNNTVLSDPATTGPARPCFEYGGGAHNGYAANNIFFALGAAKCLLGTPGGTFAFRRNNYYNASGVKITWNGVDYTSVAAWRTASAQETQGGTDVSLSTDPQLSSPGTAGTTHGYVVSLLSGYRLGTSSTASAPGTGLNISALYGITPPSQDYYGTAVTASTLPVGASATFAPASVDTIPDAFSFAAVTGATQSTVYTSNTITVSGINSPAAISVSGGTYSINGGAYTSTSGSVNNGDTVAARLTSAASAGAGQSCIVTIGGVSGTYTVTTAGTVTTTFDPTQMGANITLSTDKLTATSTVNGDKSVLSTTFKTAGVGKYVVSVSRSSINTQVGLSPILPTAGYIGSPGEGVGLSGSGDVLYNWGNIATSVSPVSGFIAFDLVNQTLYTSTDGTTWSGPYTFTNGVAGGGNIYFAASLNSGSVTVNFKPTGWTLAGFRTWD